MQKEKVKKITILPLDGIYFRIPILSVRNIEDTSNWEELFHDLIKNELFLEAIHIASEDVFNRVKAVQQGAIIDKKQLGKLKQTLLKYWIRMWSRPTPFGIFAGSMYCGIASKTSISLKHYKEHTKTSRIDMAMITEFIDHIKHDPAIKHQLTYFINSTLYGIGDFYRYIENKNQNGVRSYSVEQVERSEYLEHIFNRVGSKGATINELKNCLIEFDGIELLEAESYLQELIYSQVLVSELEPCLTVIDALTNLINKLSGLSRDLPILATLKEIQANLSADNFGFTAQTKTNKLLKTIVSDETKKNVIQTDLFINSEYASISKTSIQAILNDVSRLLELNIRNDRDLHLDEFKVKYIERYGHREMPLVEVLDPDLGIGFSNSSFEKNVILSDLDFDSKDSMTYIPWTKFEQFKVDKLTYCLGKSMSHIEITDEEIDILKDENFAVPKSMYVFGTILACSEDALDSNNFKFHLKHINGPSAANYLGRFASTNLEFAEKVRSIIRDEEEADNNKIYAEVVHLPLSIRLGNVVTRPRLRDFEIPYLGCSGLPRDQQIPVSDLQISIKGTDIMLRSKKYNKQIIPRLSSAHNFNSSPSIYKFLCSLQGHGLQTTFGWDWGVLKNSQFLPRVSYKNTILSRAQWFIQKHKFGQLEARSQRLDSLVKAFCKEWRVPRFVMLTEIDNELLIDLETQSGMDILIKELNSKGSVVLNEFLATPDNCFLKNKDCEKFLHEVIIPIKVVGEQTKIKMVFQNENDKTNRFFLTGSEWLYLKIYGGSIGADRILTESLFPIMSDLQGRNLISKWFFIRYADPEKHLRIRIKLIESRNWSQAFEVVQNSLLYFIENGIVRKLKIEEYERELERYESFMDFSEDLFHFDSEAVVKILNILQCQNDDNRWLAALVGIDQLLTDLATTVDQKMEIISELKETFFTEFGSSKNLRLVINTKYRKYANLISEILSTDNNPDFADIKKVFQFRSKCILSIMPDGIKQQGINDLVKSYIHMFLNRVFVSESRKQEYVLYEFLYKYYNSRKYRSQSI